jgi:hypothetical protein
MSDDKVLVYLPANFSPVTLLQMRDHIEFEKIVEDWQSDLLEKKYKKVERLGGPRDKSRDIACTDQNDDLWIYQCKHYKDKISKEEVFPEIGKCCYFCFKKDFKVPKKYYFISPQGVTTPMKDLFDSPDRLKTQIKLNWDSHCSRKITEKAVIELTGDFMQFVNNLDFSIFYYYTPEQFVEDFKNSPKFEKWFGSYVKPKKMIIVPNEIQAIEIVYIKKILDAYSDKLQKNIDKTEKLKNEHPEFLRHFEDQRRYFFSAEFVAAIDRGSHPAEFQWFEHLKNEFYEGILETVDEDAENGYIKLKKVLKRAAELNPDQRNPLTRELDMDRKKGMCHELANDEKRDVVWTKKRK